MNRTRLFALAVSAVLSGGVYAADAVDAANEFPVLKPGLWEYQRANNAAQSHGTGQPPPQTARQCTSPTEDMKHKWTQLAAKECQFTPILHDGSRYQYRSMCRREGAEVLITSVVTVKSDSEYRVNTQTRSAGGTSTDVVVAHRIGDCAVPATAARMQLNPTFPVRNQPTNF